MNFFLTNVKLFHIYIKVPNTTSDIGQKSAISNIFNRFEYISSVVWNKYLVVHLTSICTTFWTGKSNIGQVHLLQKEWRLPKNFKIASGQYNLPWAIMTNHGHITGPLWKHPFLNILINQSISILNNLHSFWRQ